MKKGNRNAIKLLLIISLFFLIGTLRFVETDYYLIKNLIHLTAHSAYVTLLTIWGVLIRRKIINRTIKDYMTCINILMLFWLLVRTLKWSPFANLSQGARFLWYCYYIPFILIPTIGYYISINLDKNEKTTTNKRHYLIAVLAILLITGVLTNDIHQWVFRFPFGIEDWADTYSYDAIYYLIVAWIILLQLFTLGMLFYKSYKILTKKHLWLPMIVVIVGITYAILYAIEPGKRGVGFIEATVMYCFLTVMFWESLIQIGLIPSNIRYKRFFELSNLPIQIADCDGKINFESKNAKIVEDIDEKTFSKLIEKQKIEIDSDTLLHTLRISGGHVIWQEDISRINEIIEELEDVGKELQDGVDILKYEVEAKKKIKSVTDKNLTYNMVFKQMESELEKIKRELSKAKKADLYEKISLLKEINFRGIYVKRRSNIILIKAEGEKIAAEELGRAIEESIEDLKYWGFPIGFFKNSTGEIGLNTALILYDFFIETMERVMEIVRAVYVTLTDRGEYVVISIQMENNGEALKLVKEQCCGKETMDSRGQIYFYREGEDIDYISLKLPKKEEEG